MSIKKLIIYFTFGEIISSSLSLAVNNKLPFQKVQTYETTITKISCKDIEENMDNVFKEKSKKIYITKSQYDKYYSKTNLNIDKDNKNRLYSISNKDLDQLEICKELFHDGKINELTYEVFNEDLPLKKNNDCAATITYTDIDYNRLGPKKDDIKQSISSIVFGAFIGLFGYAIDSNNNDIKKVKVKKIKHTIN